MLKAFDSTENIETSLLIAATAATFFVSWQTTCHGVLRMKLQKPRPSDVTFAALIKLYK